MKYWVTYPIVSHPPAADLMDRAGLIRFAETAEAAGFDGLGFTDHPAPSHKWLQAGGHDALDPLAALAFVAGRTERMLLMPHILVLPYRNPFLVAKGAATLDLLSGGRFVLSVAAGYQRAEFTALGVDYEQRNELFDEAVEVHAGRVELRRLRLRGPHLQRAGRRPTPSRRTSRSGSAATAGSSASGWPATATAGARSPRRRRCPARPRRQASRRRPTWP